MRAKKTSDKLYLHASGQFAKRVAGKVRYFGRDLKTATARWHAEKPFLLAGLTVRSEPKPTQSTLATLCIGILTHKQSLADSGQFSLRTIRDYRLATQHLLSFFSPHRLLTDLRPADFVEFRTSVAANVSAVTCANRLRYIRAILKYAYDAELIDRPIRFERSLALPPAALMRRERLVRGALLFTAAEIRLLLNGGMVTNDAGNPVDVAGASCLMRAVILLSINAAFGSTDCCQLTFQFLDLDNGWHTFPRTKTHAERKCWLWPETVEAIGKYLKVRPSPVNPKHSDRVFLTQHGGELVTVSEALSGNGPRINVIDYPAKSFTKLLDRLKIRRNKIGLYTLRRTHRTVSDELLDQPAASLICGHIPSASDMSAVYRQSISDERLKTVSIYVRNWLLSTP